jgi:hypothetical protein
MPISAAIVRQGVPVSYAHFSSKPARWFGNPSMSRKRALTINEVAKMGGHATSRKYGKRQLREWGRLGGRPKKSKAQ